MKKELFEELLESVKQGAAIMKETMKPSRTFEFPESEVREIREQYGLTQEKFATLMGISVATLRNWEQGRRKPGGPARVLLKIAAKHPDALLDIVPKNGRKRTNRSLQRTVRH